MADFIVIVALAIFGFVGFRIIQRHLADDLFRLKGDIEAIQLKVSVYNSKVAVLEQYIEEYWHTIPESEAENVEMLHHIREGLDRLLAEARRLAKQGDREGAESVLEKLRGGSIVLGSNLDMYQLVRWEERGHKLILKMCQKLTLEASVAKKAVASEVQYRRTPTLLSLREISELLREERSSRF